MADLSGNDRLSPFVKVGSALEAIRLHTLQKMEVLYSEMEIRMSEKRQSLDEIVSMIAAVDPRSGKVLTLDQFEEYVRLQTQVVRTLREASDLKVSFQEEFASMLMDINKLFVPSMFFRFATRPWSETCLEEESEKLHACTQRKHGLMAIRARATDQLDALHLEMDQKKAVVADVISRILEMDPRVGRVLTIAEFEEYVALQKRLVAESKAMVETETKMREEIENMLRDSKDMFVPRGNFHRFVTDPFQETPPKPLEQDCSLAYKIVSYAFLLLTCVASVIVSRPKF